MVVSGIGLIGPTGLGIDAFWTALLEGRSGVRRIRRFDTTSYPCQVGGEVDDDWYADLLPPHLARHGTHVAQLAVAATELALRDARFSPPANGPADSLGVAIGTALGGLREGHQQHAVLLERGARRVNPFVTNSVPNHAAAAEVATYAGACGPQLTYSTGCAASLQAITHAAHLIAAGELEACLAGGSESPLSPLVIAGMGRTHELAKDSDDPTRASRPFDRTHNGMVLSEGSCVLLLESLESAQRRGAIVYAEVLGGRSACDAAGLYQLDTGGNVAARCLQQLLGQHRLEAGDVHWISSHANSSPGFDRKEARVVKQAFGEFAARIPVSSIKAILGHPFGAAGAFQTAAACLALREQIIPPTHHLDDPDDDCDLDHVPNVPRPAALQHVVVTSYGYGGVNSYLLLRRYT